jgi:predicted MPP superfamily phosphohydrolase
MLNLIGVDDPAPARDESDVYRYLQQVKGLVMPNRVNILLTHYPSLFDYPELDIDLTLAGDLHGGGQLSFDFVRRGLNLGS